MMNYPSQQKISLKYRCKILDRHTSSGIFHKELNFLCKNASELLKSVFCLDFWNVDYLNVQSGIGMRGPGETEIETARRSFVTNCTLKEKIKL